MLRRPGLLTYAALWSVLVAGVAAVPTTPAPESVSSHTVALDRGETGADALVEAMQAHRPAMSKANAKRFEAVLAAARAGERKALSKAWAVFADEYFNAKTRAHARALKLVVLAAAADRHAPALAKKARVAAESKTRRDRLRRYIAAVEEALSEAERTGKPVAAPSRQTARPTKTVQSAEALQDQLMLATKQMQEMNQSFNLQYLRLQQSMQQHNREFTMVSNIMKTKHDTAKNAINNVR